MRNPPPAYLSLCLSIIIIIVIIIVVVVNIIVTRVTFVAAASSRVGRFEHIRFTVDFDSIIKVKSLCT